MPVLGVVSAQPVADVVRVLENMLVRARAGEIRAVCIAAAPQGKEVEIHCPRDPADQPLIYKMVTGAAFIEEKLLDELKAGSRAI